MTVTSNGTQPYGVTDLRNRIIVERVYTTPGVHPYDEVSWESTDIVLKNYRDGSVNFAQLGTEFPSSWSLNARHIVASKYFRGKQGSPDREWSLKQVIDRVANTYADRGAEFGYFASDEDVEIFRHELIYMLLHQIFAFNSPVWFNVGTKSKQQVSACFLLAVEDDMEAILDWYKEEGMIFRGGSGAGVNLSRLRGSKELLSSGGTASGPVSFMRGADASAGTIQSGGANRRAAKLVCLDVDHPDIMQFIAIKAREEDKIRALKAAGFDMDMASENYNSVQYQNANNSVRVSDEFMRAVEADRNFALHNRVDGSVAEALPARQIFTAIAQAAWECADPGIQYDDTINRWHTSPESGRITTSNPCVTADTQILTSEGLRRIVDLDGAQFEVWNGSGRWAPSRAFKTGTREVYRIRLASGLELRATEEHLISLTGDGGQDVPVSSLIGKKVRPLLGDGSWSGEAVDPDWALLLGLLFGDGYVRKDGIAGLDQGVCINTNEPEVLAFLRTAADRFDLRVSTHDSDNVTYVRGPGFRESLEKLGFWDQGRARTWERRVPEVVYGWSPDAVRAFLRGVYSANGCAMGKYNRIALKTASRGLAQDVQRLLVALGFNAYFTTNAPSTIAWSNGEYTSRESYDVQVGSAFGFAKFQQEIGFLHEHKTLQRPAGDPSVQRDPRASQVVSVELDGVEEVYDFSEPQTVHGWANGLCVHNCSEYMHLDNSSCNLASLNLLKFLTPDLGFDSVKFARAVEFIITAMDISISFADFPTKKIGETTRAFRQLGIGYANLGALLMAMGRAYDSKGGRDLAGAITSLMTAVSYRRSAEIAGRLGAYEGHSRNESAHKSVIEMHSEANVSHLSDADEDLARRIFDQAQIEWDDALRRGLSDGYRNAQVSLLAPTGTISFMMDCDTTGVEPDFMLLKSKKMHGGGSMTIVNQTVPLALRNLGYTAAQIEAIVEFIRDNNSVVDAPGLLPEHYAVFDCAVGKRFISPMGHVLMMAAVQPFLSGAISKTVNLPEDATVEDVAQVYMQGWKLGLKALAVYRDNCKATQPLATGGSSQKTASSSQTSDAEATGVVKSVPAPPVRRRLPSRRAGLTTSFAVGGADGYLTASNDEDGQLGEIFLKLGKQGSTLAGVMDAFSIAVSIGLQYGIPLETFAEKFTGMQFEPRGMTNDPDVRLSTSVLDYVFRRLCIDYLPREQREALGLLSVSERAEALEPVAESVETEPAAHTPAEPQHVAVAPAGFNLTAPLCGRCGIAMRKAGVCWTCDSCGDTSGCS